MVDAGVVERAAALARRWADEAGDGPLGGVLAGPEGLPFAIAAVDGVLRTETLPAAAQQLHRAALLAPHVLPWYVRGAVRASGVIAPALPAPTVPLTRRALRVLLARFVLDARPAKLSSALERLRAEGEQPVLRPVGVAVIGDEAAARRLEAARALVERDDVHEVTLRLRDVLAPWSPWAFGETVADAVERLAPLVAAATAEGTRIALEVRERRDLDLTVAVLTALHEDPRTETAEATLALPGDVAVWRELRAWARSRTGRVTLRLVTASMTERADAEGHGWPDLSLAPLTCLDEALHPDAGVRVSIGDHDPLHLAAGALLARERGVAVEAVVPLGIPSAYRQAIARDLDEIVVDAPVCAADDLDIGFLVRRLRELASIVTGSAREPVVEEPGHGAREQGAPDAPMARPASADSLTQAVLGIARGETEPIAPVLRFGGDEYVETAVFARRERRHLAAGAPGFRNLPDTDPVTRREWARDVIARLAQPAAPPGEIDGSPARVRAAAEDWGRTPAAERAAVLDRVADVLDERRVALIEAAVADVGALFADADGEVTEAVDAVSYSAATARALDAVAGAVFVPDLVTVVATGGVRAVADAAEGMASALGAGSGVVLASNAPRCAALLIDAFRAAGVPHDLLSGADGDLDEHLVDAADRVVLTGTRADAVRLREMRPDLPIVGQAGGTGVVVVMPSADLERAASDLVASAFARSGQSAEAVSLAILVGAVGHSKRFVRRLADAAGSLRVGVPGDPRAQIGPLAAPPGPELERALTVLGEGERWLVEPRRLDDDGLLWSPGIRIAAPSSARPLPAAPPEAARGPVLTLVHVASLADAVELQNAVSSGLAACLYTRDPVDLETWLDTVEAGNLSVNRGLTERKSQRRPFGGWDGSAIGPGAKAGGANRLAALGSWRAADGAAPSSTLHLRGLDTRIASLIESAQPTLDYPAFEWLRRGALSDAVAWRRDVGQVRDEAQLEFERNLVRYRPAPVEIRAEVDAAWHRLLRVVVAGIRAGSPLVVSAPLGLPATVRQLLRAQQVGVFVETDQQWIERLALQRPARVRIVGRPETVARTHRALAEAIGGDPAVAVYAGEVTTAGRVELLPFVREQSISICAHRYGVADPWSEEVV